MLSAGIVMSELEFLGSIYFQFLLLTVLLGVVTLHLLDRFKSFTSILLLISFVLLGIVHGHVRKPIPPFFNSPSVSAVVHVNEIADPDKEWRKAVCELIQIVEDSTIKESQGKLLLFIQSEVVEEGDVLMVRFESEPILNRNNPGEFDAQSYWKNKHVEHMGFVVEENIQLLDHREKGWVGQSIEWIRSSLSEALSSKLEGDELSIAQALLLGDKSQLSTETRNSFSRAGAMHVLAVSGLHVGIILYLLIFVLGRFPRIFTKNRASIVAILIIWIFAAITGFSPSVMRASFMFSFIALGQLSGRKVDSLNILFFSAFVLLMINPFMLFDIGFQLSYLALIGILTLYRPISKLIYIRNKILRKAWEGTAVGIAAQTFTVPLSLYYFHQFPNYFALSNLGIMLFAGLILGMGLLFFLVKGIPMVSSFMGMLLGMMIMVLLFFIQFIERMPGAVAYGFSPSENILIIIYITLLLAILLKTKKLIRWGAIVILFTAFAFLEFQRFQNGSKSELVVFNDRTPIISMKCKDQLVYISRSKEKAEYIMKAYLTIHPSNAQFIELKEGMTTIEFEGEVFKLTSSINGVLIERVGGEDLFLRTSYGEQSSSVSQVIDMPYLELNEDNYNLRKGAYHLSLE